MKDAHLASVHYLSEQLPVS